MVMGKRAEINVNGNVEQTKPKRKRAKKEVIEQPVEEVIEETILPETNEEEEKESEGFSRVLNEFREDGGWVHIKKKVDGKIVKIGKYRPNDFDKDEIAKEFGGGTYYYDLRDNNGVIRARSEETYLEKKDQPKSPENDMMLQMAQLIKEQTKEIETLKAMINQPKIEDKKPEQNLIITLIQENQKNQADMIKAIADLNKPQPQQQVSMTEMLTMITTIVGLIVKQQPQQQEQQKVSMSDMVELAGLFADMKNSGEMPKQETLVDIIKTFITDGSLTNVIAMLKQPKAPIIASPNQQKQLQQNQSQQVQQQQQPSMTEKDVMQTVFKQYEQQLFQMKVNGNNAEYIATTILSAFDFSEDLKKIGYTYFKDKEQAYNGLMEVATVFKNEQELLKKIVEIIHNYFDYDEQEGDTENANQN